MCKDSRPAASPANLAAARSIAAEAMHAAMACAAAVIAPPRAGAAEIRSSAAEPPLAMAGAAGPPIILAGNGEPVAAARSIAAVLISARTALAARSYSLRKAFFTTSLL